MSENSQTQKLPDKYYATQQNDFAITAKDDVLDTKEKREQQKGRSKDAKVDAVNYSYSISRCARYSTAIYG